MSEKQINSKMTNHKNKIHSFSLTFKPNHWRSANHLASTYSNIYNVMQIFYIKDDFSSIIRTHYKISGMSCLKIKFLLFHMLLETSCTSGIILGPTAFVLPQLQQSQNVNVKYHSLWIWSPTFSVIQLFKSSSTEISHLQFFLTFCVFFMEDNIPSAFYVQ